MYIDIVKNLIKEILLYYINSDKKEHFIIDCIERQQIEKFLNVDLKKELNIEYIYEKIKYLDQFANEKLKDNEFIALEYLFKVFDLDYIQRIIVLMVFCTEIDGRFGDVYAYCNNNIEYRLPNIRLFVDLFSENILSYFSEDSICLKFFIEIRPIQIDSNLGYYLKLRDRIRTFTICLDYENKSILKYGKILYTKSKEDIFLNEQIKIIEDLIQNKYNNKKFIYLYGIKGIGKHNIVRYIAYKKGYEKVFFININKILVDNDIINEIVLECKLQNLYICFYDNSNDIKDNVIKYQIINKIAFLISDYKEVFFISDYISQIEFDILDYEQYSFCIKLDNILEVKKIWEFLSKDYIIDKSIDFFQISDNFIFTISQIKKILKNADNIRIKCNEKSITKDILYKACYMNVENNLASKTTQVNLIYSWSDLVLPQIQKNMLKSACNQVKYKYKVYNEWKFNQKIAYGTGVSIIFSGSPGTGKTMAAQVMAKELNLELYKVDLSTVISKYIGDTEKNLKEIFNEAKKAQVILFFDEADVLFSKRTEVKTSNDKYNNMEAAFMLQKIEEYSGMIILATNYMQNIDEAFKRRMKYIIEFPFPNKDSRILIWKNVFPSSDNLSKDIDFEFLANNFELSGSNIKNVAVQSAFYAISENKKISMRHLLKAIKEEFAKSGKILTKNDLGIYID